MKKTNKKKTKESERTSQTLTCVRMFFSWVCKWSASAVSSSLKNPQTHFRQFLPPIIFLFNHFMFSYSFFFNQILSLCLRGRILQFKSYPNMWMHFVHTFLFMFPKVMIKRLFENQELLKLMIISFILKTFKFDSRMILWGEIRHPSKG